MTKWTGTIVAGVLAGVITLGSLPALAGTYGPYGNRWELRQRHRICQGVRSGHLTPGEFRHLRHQQKRIHHAEARMWADGHLNRRERAQLNRIRHQSNQQTYRYNHNYRGAAWMR